MEIIPKILQAVAGQGYLGVHLLSRRHRPPPSYWNKAAYCPPTGRNDLSRTFNCPQRRPYGLGLNLETVTLPLVLI